jgi:hypothetical protein
MPLYLSSITGGGVNPYLEYAVVCPASATNQTIPQNTVTTLTLDTEVTDTGGYGLLSNNRLSLSAGTYYFEANVFAHGFGGQNGNGANFGLYNITSGNYVTRCYPVSYVQGQCATLFLKGQMTLSTAATFDLRIWANGNGGADIGGAVTNDNISSISGAGTDQRTTIKLWKLA